MPTFKLAVSGAEIDEGSNLFATFCSRCHGGDVVSSGLVPDLRYANASMHQMFQQIVRGGALREFGMPSFSDDLTSAQVRSIEGYVLNRAQVIEGGCPQCFAAARLPLEKIAGPMESSAENAACP